MFSDASPSPVRPHALYAYPWDLGGAEGLPATLTEAVSLGVGGLTLAAAYHAGKFLRPRHGVIFPEDGTVYFRPRLEGYGRLRPRAASMVEAFDPFEALRDRGLRLQAWTVLLHNSRLGAEHPDCCARNAFGDAYVYSLCPAHPEVRDYAIALCKDLGDRGLDGLSLESPGWLVYAHGYHHEFQQVPLDGWLQALLSLCFCESCLRGAGAAGVDAPGLRTRVKGWIHGFLQSPVETPEAMAAAWMQADLLQDPDLAAFLRWRCTVVTELLREIRAEVPKSVEVSVIATCQRPHATAFWEGMDLAALARVADRLELPLYQPDPAGAEADFFDVRRRVGEAAHLSVILRPGPPDMASEGQLRETLRRLRALGVRSFSFYNYGLLRSHHLGWIRAALADLETL